LGFRVSGSGFMVSGSGFSVLGFGLWVSDFGVALRFVEAVGLRELLRPFAPRPALGFGVWGFCFCFVFCLFYG